MRAISTPLAVATLAPSTAVCGGNGPSATVRETAPPWLVRSASPRRSPRPPRAWVKGRLRTRSTPRARPHRQPRHPPRATCGAATRSLPPSTAVWRTAPRLPGGRHLRRMWRADLVGRERHGRRREPDQPVRRPGRRPGDPRWDLPRHRRRRRGALLHGPPAGAGPLDRVRTARGVGRSDRGGGPDRAGQRLPPPLLDLAAVPDGRVVGSSRRDPGRSATSTRGGRAATCRPSTRFAGSWPTTRTCATRPARCLAVDLTAAAASANRPGYRATLGAVVVVRRPRPHPNATSHHAEALPQDGLLHLAHRVAGGARRR